MAREWIDFKKVKAAVDFQRLLDHYGITGMVNSGDELRGPCPIHKGSPRSKNFSVNMQKNAFKCFASECKAKGNILDFVAAMEHCDIREAALKIAEWFKIGDSADSRNHIPGQSKASAIESLINLVVEIEDHNTQILQHASMVEEKLPLMKELAAVVAKEVQIEA